MTEQCRGHLRDQFFLGIVFFAFEAPGINAEATQALRMARTVCLMPISALGTLWKLPDYAATVVQ